MKPIYTGIFLALWLGSTWAQTPGPLIDAAWIAENSCLEDVRVLDIRSQKIDGESRSEYLLGHIPCAMHTDYVKGGWRAKKGTVPGMLPPVEELERLIGEMGIDGTTHVVVAPLGENAKSMAAATRVYWTFKLLGHDRVSILNGGTRGYAADKSLPLETGTATRASKEFIARLRPEMIADHEQVAKAAADGVAYDGSMAQWSRLDERPVEQKVVVAD